MNSRMLENLKQLGFNVYEARVYVEKLKQVHPLTAYEIGKLSGVPRSKVYEVVDNLRRKQTIVQIEDHPKKYLPVDPEEVFSNIKKSFITSVNFVRDELDHLEKGEAIDYVFNIFGKETIIDRAREMVRSAKSSILIAVDHDMLKALEADLKKAEQRGLELYMVFYGDKKKALILKTCTAIGSGSRISKTFPLYCLISTSKKCLPERCRSQKTRGMVSGRRACT